jgi:L-ribulose-5-phosphate 3-epimerase
MLLGYNTNGLAHHDPLAAIALLAELGYESVALTIDHGLLDPRDDRLPEQLAAIRAALTGYGMRSVIETGARFLLDPRNKHEPTLMSEDFERARIRIEFLKHAIDMARELKSDCVSLWSGILRDDVSRDTALARLSARLDFVIDYAANHGVTLAFEPEPGMFIDTMDRYDELCLALDAPHFRLMLDVGHLHCLGETPIPDVIRRYGERIANVHIEDMRAGVHEHLMFGEGEIDFPPLIEALREVGYSGGLHVELSRHSHEGPSAASRAYKFLAPLVKRKVEG